MTTTNNLDAYRASEREQIRTADLLRLMPTQGKLALDVGARDGYFSQLMTQYFDKVVALDLVKPGFQIQGIDCVAGDVTALAFPDAHFDFILCAEVLEHVPPQNLATACRELARVCRGQLLLGVPDRQDLRVGRTTCQVCGRTNPPWGHVNSFDDRRLQALFEGYAVREISRVGTTNETTNTLSAWLMDLAGNPYGTYHQEEPCVHCGSALGRPTPRTLPQKLLTKLAFWTRSATTMLSKPRANWMHVLFTKSPDI